MDKNFMWALMLKNIVVVLAWTTLAILFNKWWVALLPYFS